MFAYKPSGGVAAAGTANTHNILSDMGGAAKWLAITDTHATGKLEITLSENGTDYTAAEFDVNGAQTVILAGLNVASIKVDASVNGTTYTILAGR